MKNVVIFGLLVCIIVLMGESWAQETVQKETVRNEMAHKAAADCNDPVNTREMNDCARQKTDEAQLRLDSYIAKANEQYHDDPKAVEALQLSQRDWLTYRESYCNAVYQLWRDGSIRGVMYQGCMLQLTVQRTHNIWQDYLTFMDSSAPILPEPH
ncbi:lysozyme inhibitor LprI family protein [Shewanella frigidimarina]|jgi:uncharacterized protein YecT (DUF1311 family)|uniref:lysozyme inhibitor LprI family protein n=1 Tax=Shewanella frigidimarina TaxID=56812 RepID=UPI003D7B3BB5